MITSRPPTAITTCFVLMPAEAEALDRIGDDAGIHDFALDDGVIDDTGVGHLGQDRIADAVSNGDQLDQAGPDVQGHSGLLAAE